MRRELANNNSSDKLPVVPAPDYAVRVAAVCQCFTIAVLYQRPFQAGRKTTMDASRSSELDDTDSSNKADDDNTQEKDTRSIELREDSDPEGDASAMRADADAREELRRRRELNRLSKIRCRKRRSDLIKSLQADVSRLATEYHSLRTENEQLRQEFLQCCQQGGQGQIQPSQVDQMGFPLSQGLLFPNSITASALMQGAGNVAFAPHWASQQIDNFAARPVPNFASIAFSAPSAVAELMGAVTASTQSGPGTGASSESWRAGDAARQGEEDSSSKLKRKREGDS